MVYDKISFFYVSHGLLTTNFLYHYFIVYCFWPSLIIRRIQNLQQLQDGAGISITKAKYITPLGNDIHGVGITPDVQLESCGINDSAKDCMSEIAF